MIVETGSKMSSDHLSPRTDFKQFVSTSLHASLPYRTSRPGDEQRSDDSQTDCVSKDVSPKFVSKHNTIWQPVIPSSLKLHIPKDTLSGKHNTKASFHEAGYICQEAEPSEAWLDWNDCCKSMSILQHCTHDVPNLNTDHDLFVQSQETVMLKNQVASEANKDGLELINVRADLESHFQELRREFEEKTGRTWVPLMPMEDEEWDWFEDEMVDGVESYVVAQE
jgi:hypothetical protein